MAWTVEDITASAKRRARIPTAQTAFMPADFIAIANEELQTYVVPVIASQREDYFIAHYDVAIGAGQIEYRLPTRAVGQALRSVWLIDAVNALRPFPRIARESLVATPEGFYLDGNVLEIATDNPDTVGTLGNYIRMTYLMRPGTLVASSAVGTVQSINAIAKQVTLTATPPAGFSSGALYDLIRAIPGFECLAIDQTATIAGSTLTFANPLPSDLLVGDTVALAGQSNIPQVPPEAHALLAQRVAVKCLESMGDTEQIGIAGGVLKRMEDDLAKLVTPRVAGNLERIVNRGSHFRSTW